MDWTGSGSEDSVDRLPQKMALILLMMLGVCRLFAHCLDSDMFECWTKQSRRYHDALTQKKNGLKYGTVLEVDRCRLGKVVGKGGGCPCADP